MSAEDEIDVLRISAGSAKVFKIRTIAHVELRKITARLEIAATSVDKNCVMCSSN